MRTKNPSYREEPNPTDVMVEAQETRGDEPEETESNPPSNRQDSTEPEEEIEAMQPLNIEMALMSGLNCREYPPFMEGFGSLEFAGKYFGVGATVTYAKVKAKLLSMKEPGTDRLKMAVLFFLSSIIIGKKKGGKQAPSVEPIFLRVVDDLEECKTFPWGRLAFDENMKDIFHLMNHFDGVVGAPWVFPSFVIPLEEIHSILPPSSRETHLLGRIMETDNGWNDADYPIADGWSKRLIDQEKSILFEDLYNQDVATRGIEVGDVELDNVDPDDVATDDVEHDNVDPDDMEHDNVDQDDVTPNNLVELGDIFIQLEDQMNKGFKEIMEKIDGLDGKVKSVESYVNWERGAELGCPTFNEVTEKEKAEREQAEKEKAEKENAERENAEKEKADNAEKEKAEKEMAEKEKAEKEKAEKEKVEAEKEKAEKERVEKEKAEKEKAEKEKAEKELAEKEMAEKEKAEKELAEKEKAEKERVEKEKAEKEKAGKELAEKEKAEKERVEKEKAEKEKAEKEMAEKEKAEAEKAVAEKVEAEKVEGEKEKAVNDQEEKVEGERQISIQYERKSRKRNAEVQGEEEVAGEAQQNKKMKIIGKKGKKGSTVVIRSHIMTRQKKEQKKD
ncbi:unnamed protein product [Arabidopsis arenosa]|uniref:DUF1985 domain-containing protein n=1 Tax=Arabidopsis arenosa TaxID=38785 RepID=A0A8S2AY87_ARAAE|nr:unnamed protein product [Arabidopsis arenosa]